MDEVHYLVDSRRSASAEAEGGVCVRLWVLTHLAELGLQAGRGHFKTVGSSFEFAADSSPPSARYLLPLRTKASKRKTPVVKKTLNPHYNHTFVYNGLRLEDLQHMCLELTVWDREPLASNDFLGGVRLGVGTGESLSPPPYLSQGLLDSVPTPPFSQRPLAHRTPL